MQADAFHLIQGESPPIESWDDDEDLQCLDDIQFHAISTTTSVTGSMLRSGHRDSISSRRSVRSDVESNAGDEDWQLLLRDNDETATEEAIASARKAGIPIPDGVPKAALLSGSIKKLQSKQNKRSAIDDWSEDLEFPATDMELALKSPEEEPFPETIHQIHTPLTASPVKTRDSAASTPLRGAGTSPQSSHVENTTQQDLQDIPRIIGESPRLIQPRTPIIGSHASLADVARDTDEFEKDFEFPTQEMTLKLSPPASIPNTIPSITDDIWDIDWADGSVSGHFSSTKRDGRSTHSSSVSAFSPSASSCLTAETEDDGLDGLVLPDGPLNFEENLKKRKIFRSDTEEISPKSRLPPSNANDNHNFFEELDVDDASVFLSTKPNVNRNVKRKSDRPTTPSRSEKTITFTNKTLSLGTRIPRLSGHTRSHTSSHTSLESVSESGNPLIHFRRPQSRLTAHGNRSSVGSIHTSPPVTPSGGRRSLGSRMTREGINNDASSSHAQFLKAKRSAPSIRGPEESTSTMLFQRPSSRQEGAVYARPKTPIDRTTTDSRLANHRSQAPFLPAGASQSQSHHVSLKYTRHFRRSDSENSTDSTVGQKSISRLSYPLRSETPSRHHTHSVSEGSTLTAKRTITRPARRRNYGDGTELESFDDLPTSATIESRFVKTPVGHGAPRSVRSRLPQSPTTISARTETPLPPVTSSASSRPSSFTPRFARDTNASRIAREQRIASLSLPSRNRESTPLAPLSTNWKGQQTPRQGDSMLNARSKKGKASRPGGGSRPQLIRPMGSGVSEAKSVKGMQYNPSTYRWEGNENEVAEFDVVNTPRSPKVAPALITSVGTIKGAQVVGGMVFDPQRMCWLKLASTQPGADKVAVVHDDIEDVFAGLDDLQDRPEPKHRRNISEASITADGFDDQSGDSSEEWPITEEFDVGPEFVKRQRAEEDRWKRKVTKWVTSERQRLGDGWRWAIRDLVPSGN